MKLPLTLDVDLLCVYDDAGELIFSRDPRRVVAAVNFARFCTVDGMEQIGALPIDKVAVLELEVRGLVTEAGPVRPALRLVPR